MKAKWSAPKGEHTMLLLVSGMLIIGRVEERDDSIIWLHKPCTIQWGVVPRPDGAQQVQVNIVDFLPPFAIISGQEDWPFKILHVIVELEPKKELAAVHIQQTSGIQIAPAGAEKNLPPQGKIQPAR